MFSGQTSRTVPLKITLKPRERILLGGALLKNGDHLSQLTVENEVPILREKDILSERDTDTVAKRIYYVIQLMYFEGAHLSAHHKTFWELVRQLSTAAPSVLPLIDEIGELILDERYYQALKATRKLIAYEEELMLHAHAHANERPKSIR